MNKTPLFDTHRDLGATIGDFGGWSMPLWYKTGQLKEHIATREACGIFDICHMGEFIVTGKDTLAFWNRLLSNAITAMVDGQAMYNFMLNEEGGVVDDCILYRFSATHWMLVVNAGTQDGDLAWLKKHQSGDVKIENIGPATGKLDLQGPTAPKVVAKLVGKEKLAELKFFRFIPEIVLGGVKCLLSRTGYTGEVGFEIYCPINETKKLWDALMSAGAEFGITPAGLGARDTLRLEAGLPLHGHEIGPTLPAVGTPWEFAINYDHEFIGKAALLANRGKYFVYPVIVEGRRKPGSHAHAVVGGKECGEVTSDILAVSLDKKPAGFIRTTCELKSGDALTLKNAQGAEFAAKVMDNPLWKGTSRKKMDSFL